jgi:uncharacterized protein
VIQAVIDTNVLVSGLLSPAGNEALILLAVARGMIRPLVSRGIMEEYAEVLARPKFGFAADEISALMTLFRDAGEFVEPHDPTPALPDPEDAKFLACALSGRGEYLVTGNRRHFPQAVCEPVRVVTAREILSRIASEI